MNIALWSDTFPPQVNGVASVTRDLAAALAEEGHNVMVFTVTRGSALPAADRTPFAVHKIPSFSLPKFIYSGDSFSVAIIPGPRTIGALKKFKPDILHAHTPFLAGWSAVIAKKMLGVPLVGTHHTFYDDYLKHVKMDYPIGRAFSWKVMVAYYNRADAVTSPSRALGDMLRQHGLKQPLHIIPNPADTEFFTPAPTPAARQRSKERFGAGKHAIVYMGRVSYEKDIDQAIAAFAIVARDISDATLMVIGDGPERKRLEAASRKLPCADRIIFTGMLRGDALRDALRANDIFLTASRSENMPVSILEAMACGLPIASVRAKGIPEIVQHGVNGFLAEPGRPDLLAQAITTLLSSHDHAAHRAASRKLAEQYSKKSIARQNIALYRDIIEKKREKRRGHDHPAAAEPK
jgi:glycosyltransferase involved in cell wall biosynthesis